MKKPFFVMLYNQTGTRLVPLRDPADNLIMYATREEAESAARRTIFGEHFGFDVFKAGEGVLP